MAKLYFRYGAMGSSKTANALMVKYNYEERGQHVIIAKPAVDTRNGTHRVYSRCGLESKCVLFNELDLEQVKKVDCLIVDEAQFLTKQEVETLVHIVDDLNIPVVCYGLRADFKGDLFPGSQWLLAWADTIEEVKTICWCGKKATCNARFDENGIIKQGEQVVLGANERYTSLCRKHWREGNLGPHNSDKTDGTN
ncbi:MAG: thymidine kinase [Acutalibacteraceae bacterium]|nr:thymidine kinase [Oscillospiraceae bacterium]